MRAIRLLILASVCLFSVSVWAGDAIEVVRADGDLTVSDASGANAKSAQLKSALPSSHVLSTGPNSRAVVRVGNTGYVVLEKNSKVEINHSPNGASFFRQLTGVIYYAVNKVKGKDHTLEVRMKSATMGIRGTRFVVADVPGRNEVGMRKGTLNVISPSEEFEIHRKAEQAEFDEFKREAQNAIAEEQKEFEEFKNQNQREVVEYKKEFLLGKDRMVSFSGKRVDDRPLSPETKKELGSAESYAAEWLNEVND